LVSLNTFSKVPAPEPLVSTAAVETKGPAQARRRRRKRRRRRGRRRGARGTNLKLLLLLQEQEVELLCLDGWRLVVRTEGLDDLLAQALVRDVLVHTLSTH
jgi:hypothetical protein